MLRRQIGNSGITCGAVGYGAMSIAGIYGKISQGQAFKVLDECLTLGMDHLDTANVYGNGLSETTIGEWLRARGPNLRTDVSIATKASFTRDPDTGARLILNTREHLESELDKSLARLGTDYVDLFYIHRRDPNMKPEEIGGVLSDLIDTGKCRSVGASEISPNTLRRMSGEVHVAAVQSEYSLSVRSPELGLVQATRDLGTALVAFCPVGRGLLTDAPTTAGYVSGSAFLAENPRFSPENLPLNHRATAGLRELGAKMGVPTAALALAWLLAQGDHVIPIPGTGNIDHLREVAAGGTLSLTDNDLAAIEQALPIGWAHGDRYSTGQWIGPEKYC